MSLDKIVGRVSEEREIEAACEFGLPKILTGPS